MRLEGKSALITGASQGLGRALALGLAEAGVKIALVARQHGPLEEAVHEIRHRVRHFRGHWRQARDLSGGRSGGRADRADQSPHQ